jgi:hypothetical protein
MKPSHVLSKVKGIAAVKSRSQPTHKESHAVKSIAFSQNTIELTAERVQLRPRHLTGFQSHTWQYLMLSSEKTSNAPL